MHMSTKKTKKKQNRYIFLLKAIDKRTSFTVVLFIQVNEVFIHENPRNSSFFK